MNTSIEIENAALVWIDVTGLIEAATDGTDDADQVIPEVTLQFRKPPTDPDLRDPSLNKWRPRIRVTEDGQATYYLMERPQGDIVQSLDSNSLYGRAWVGVLDNMRPASFEWTGDVAASTICAQVAHQDVANQAGLTVPVSWQASIDPTIPGGRYAISRVSRRQVIAAVAEACGAKVRTSLDGLALEVYDVPAKDGSETVVRRYLDGFAPFNYEQRRQFEIKNAVRVQGEKLSYVSARLPIVTVQVLPGAIDADGSSNALGRARVYDSSGRPVQHSAQVDQAIAAGSYSEIPVSSCHSVQGVWLNSGTQDSPVKGARIEPTEVTASLITVPAQVSQLFIVSYTQATAVGWNSADTQQQIDGEEQSTTDLKEVSTTQPIGRVRGVYRASDASRSGTNYFTGGSFSQNTTAITLGISPGAIGTAVLIDYDVFEANPAVNISPSSSLCDSDGWAETIIGAGNTLGMVEIIASALGQSGSASLSLTGEAIASLQVTADPQTLRAKVSGTPVAESIVDEAAQIQETSERGWSEYYIEVAAKISTVREVRVGGGTAVANRWENREDSYRIYLNGTYIVGTWAAADYTGWEQIDAATQSATITASVLDSSGDPVTDGTAVKFEFSGRTNGAILSSAQEYTAAGEAAVQLAAGDVAEFYVQVTAGPYRARVLIKVVDEPLESEQEPVTSSGSTSTGSSSSDLQDGDKDEDLADGEYVRADGRICWQVPKDWEDGYGNIRGQRQAFGCDDAPIVGANVLVDGVYSGTTGAEGHFGFLVSAPGDHTVSIGKVEATFSVSGEGDTFYTAGGDDRTYEACRDK